MGDQISVLVNKVKTDDAPVFFESLNYPANLPLDTSVATGAATLINELNYLATACLPYYPTVVLAGHSQGAMVIDSALGGGLWPNGPTLSADAKAIVSSVALFGDPGFMPGDPYNAPYSPSFAGAFPRNQLVANELATYRVWGWTEGQTDPNPHWVPRIRSYCAAGDYYCQNNPGDTNFTIHNSYKTTTMSAAYNWIRYMWTSGG